MQRLTAVDCGWITNTRNPSISTQLLLIRTSKHWTFPTLKRGEVQPEMLIGDQALRLSQPHDCSEDAITALIWCQNVAHRYHLRLDNPISRNLNDPPVIIPTYLQFGADSEIRIRLSGLASHGTTTIPYPHNRVTKIGVGGRIRTDAGLASGGFAIRCNQPLYHTDITFNLERNTRIELVSVAWKATAQPLDQFRM